MAGRRRSEGVLLTVFTGIRFSNEEFSELQSLAKKQGIHRNTLIRKLIKQCLLQDKQEKAAS